jgi:hypothetical protein
MMVLNEAVVGIFSKVDRAELLVMEVMPVMVLTIMAMFLGTVSSVLVRANRIMVVIVGKNVTTTTMMASAVLDTTVIIIPTDLVQITILIRGMSIVGMLLLSPDCLNSNRS